MLQDLPKPIRANFILNVETEELFITAGLQDRVVQVSTRVKAAQSIRNMSFNAHRAAAWIGRPLQVYEGLVYMDFSKKLIEEQGYGTKVTIWL